MQAGGRKNRVDPFLMQGGAAGATFLTPGDIRYLTARTLLFNLIPYPHPNALRHEQKYQYYDHGHDENPVVGDWG
jgi:hypothetical protein